MKKEKNVLQTTVSAGEYLAPRVKVVVVKARRVMCQSITGMSFGSEQNDGSEGDFE